MKQERRTFIISGGNSGLGFQCAKNIALENINNYVVIVSRNMEKSAGAAKDLSGETGNPNIHAMLLDLASLVSVRAFCQSFAGQDFPPLYGLVCNAIAGSAGKAAYTEDGFEETFGVGHLGHFLLANLLLRKMQNTGRIVFVSSDQHNPPRILGRLHYTDALHLARPETGNHAMRYSGTKLCNLYCAYEMAARVKTLAGNAITVNAFNPGFMADTGLGGNAKGLATSMMKSIAPLAARLLGTLSSAEKSGKLLAALMTDAAFEGVTGKYFDREKEALSSELSCNKANAVNLWVRSIELTKLQSNETVF
jgi:NAD(P)-dependent dehydrogenase (short-subunit alcohol dehydrogenase family)